MERGSSGSGGRLKRDRSSCSCWTSSCSIALSELLMTESRSHAAARWLAWSSFLLGRVRETSQGMWEQQHRWLTSWSVAHSKQLFSWECARPFHPGLQSEACWHWYMVRQDRQIELLNLKRKHNWVTYECLFWRFRLLSRQLHASLPGPLPKHIEHKIISRLLCLGHLARSHCGTGTLYGVTIISHVHLRVHSRTHSHFKPLGWPWSTYYTYLDCFLKAASKQGTSLGML